MAYWIRFSYERNEYVIDLDCVSAFSYETSTRIKFWLPDSAIPIVLNQQGYPEAYQKVHTYIEKVTGAAFDDYWIKILYERNEYVVNLKRISSFAFEQNGRVTFWLPDGAIAIIIHPQNRESYQKVIDYIQKATGYSMS